MYRTMKLTAESAKILWEEMTKAACRECKRRVNIFHDVCPECGTMNPVRFPCALASFTAFLSITAILAIRITCALTA